MDTKLDTTVHPPGVAERATLPTDTPPTAQTTDTKSEAEEPIVSEEFKVTGDALVSRIKEWIHQGNIRRVIIKNEEGRTLVELPLTASVIGTAIGATIAPEIVAVGVIGAMVTHLTVIIERHSPHSRAPEDSTAASVEESA